MADAEKNLIDSIVRDLRPVRPVRIGAVLGLLIAVEAVVLATGTACTGIRSDILERFREPPFVALLAILVTAAVGSAWAALRVSVPGRDLSRAALAGLLLLPSIAAGRLRPVIDKVFTFAELPQAKAYMESNAHLGKIIIRP